MISSIPYCATDASCQRIHDLPLNDRPREKLAQLGPSALSNEELLALFISTGTRGANAIDLGRNLLRNHGSMAALGRLTVAMLAKEKGIGPAKASKLKAAFELGARVAREESQSTLLETPEQVYAAFGPQLAHESREHVVVAVVDTRLRQVASELVSIGTINQALTHPREILRPVITRSAYGFILLHNHPTGDPTPSNADIEMTKSLTKASRLMQVELLDHVIIGRPSHGRKPFFSFREAGYCV